ncbi:MAG TPA: Fn3-like domain-containing protein, partial [Cerasibacillus sp.]|uniref:Fn3-like domain-containing protein n=1 Tax=Cerasibacillus sp. TaxID=2498711 RepID=UPI002F42AE85
GDAPVSPRRQGAGLAQFHAALKTPVMVTESQTKEAKVALKEIASNKVTFELTAENFTDEAVTYEVQGNAQTDAAANAGDVELVTASNLTGGFDLTKEGAAQVTINGEEQAEIVVPANGTTTVSVTVDVSAADEFLTTEWFTNGYWLEGFVRFVDPTDMHPDLTVPYVGFKGDWNDPPIFDKPMWDEMSYYGMTGAVTTTEEEGVFNILGVDPIREVFDENFFAISPNDDGVNDDATLILSFLRNAKHVKYNVLDENMKVVRTIHTDDNVRKNYYDGGRGPMYNLSSSRLWDGKIDGKLAPEGQYYLQAQAVIDYEGKDWQTFEVPVKVDVTAPELAVELDEATNTLHVDAQDNESGSGLWYWDVLVNGESVLDEPYFGDETEHILEGVKDSDDVSVVAVDYAGNVTEEKVHETEDITRPNVYLLTPEPSSVHPTNEVIFSGYATDDSEVVKITVDDEEVDFAYNKEENRYEFETTVHFEDGFYNAKVKAEDAAGNTREIGRKLFVDSSPAELELVSIEKVETEEGEATDADETTEADHVSTADGETEAAESETTANEKETYKVTVNVKDNFDEIRLYVNENEVYKHELSDKYSEPSAFDETIEFEVELFSNEENEFKVVDLAGHTTIKQVNPEDEAAGEDIVVNSPVVNPITEGDETITGKYEGDLPENAEAHVHIELPNGDVVVEQVDGDGNFEHQLEVDLKAGNKVNVWVTVTYNDNEYVGESVTIEVKAKEEPPTEDPEDPEKPGKPGEPGKPGKPGKPGDPGKPGKPGQKPPKVETPKDPPHPGAKKPGDGKGKGSDDDSGGTPPKGDNDGGKKGPDTNQQSDKKDGSKLPSTATNMWLYVLIGTLSVVLGGAIMFFRRRLQS